MSRQKLLAYPYIEELGYRDRIDPHKMNLMLRSIEESALRAILRGSELNTTLNQLNLGVTSSYAALAKHASTLFSYRDIPNGTAFATGFDTVNTDNGGRQDRPAGIVTLNWNENRKYSKIPRYDSDGDGIPDTVSPNVTVLVDNVARNVDNEVYNTLNRRNDSFWIEQMAGGNYPIEIQLPPSLNKNFNYLEIVPFPIFGVFITRIEYQDVRSVWQTIYDINNNDYKFYYGGGPLVLHLAPRETNGSFRIWCDVDSELGVIGFSNIDVGLIDYLDTSQTTYLKFMNMPSRTTAKDYTFLTFELDFYVDGHKADALITDLSLVDDVTTPNDDPVPIEKVNRSTYYFGGNSINLTPTENLYLKVVMKEVDMTTPVIRGCKLTYEES